jgi:predicted acetyltransferase
VGELDRPASWWPFVFAEKQTWKGGGPIFVVACEPGDGRPGGYACYTVDRDRTVGPSALVVREVVAADAEVRGALWRHLLDVDLVGRIEASIAVDDELRHRLVDWRALRVTETVDFLWARVLDPVAAFGARRYPVTDSLVVEIDDPFRPATAGRYRIDGGPDGAEVTRVTSEPDLSLGIDTLGSLYLGGVGVEPLARAGRVVGRTPEVVGRADRFFAAGGPGPFCSTSF